jgi:hypothetical protein
MAQQLNYNQVVGANIEVAPQFTGFMGMEGIMFDEPNAPITLFTKSAELPREFPTEAYQLQPGDTINSQENLRDTRSIELELWGNAYTRKDWLGMAMGQNGVAIDPYQKTAIQVDWSLDRKFAELTMKNFFRPVNQRLIQVDYNQAPYSIVSFPTAYV